jgi:hypothetical protein
MLSEDLDKTFEDESGIMGYLEDLTGGFDHNGYDGKNALAVFIGLSHKLGAICCATAASLVMNLRTLFIGLFLESLSSKESCVSREPQAQPGFVWIKTIQGRKQRCPDRTRNGANPSNLISTPAVNGKWAAHSRL